MWSPTHILVTVHRAKGLLTKGKNGTNNCFVTIALGKEKFQTSIKEKVNNDAEWHEECELTIPEHGNRAELILTCLHRNNLQLDEFLGQVTIPLQELDAYEKSRSKWLKLQSKPGKEKKQKERGDLEVRIAFTVKSGSLTDLNKKEKKHTASIGGSLLSLGTLEKRKSLKKFAKSLGSKVHISGKSKKGKDVVNDSTYISGSISSISTVGSGSFQPRRYGQTAEDADPGVISEDEDEFAFDNLSHKSSGSLSNVRPHNLQELHKTQQDNQLKQFGLKTGNHILEQDTIKNSHPNTSPISDHAHLRSKTLPPSRPPFMLTTKNVNMQRETIDEWEAKLCGKNLEDGSSDSLKRRSWENSRMLLNSTQSQTFREAIKNQDPTSPNTAPTSPNLAESKKNENQIVPKPLPRSSTLENIESEKYKKNDKSETKIDRRFSKLKSFLKEKTSSEDVRKNVENQFSERIIIGHENDFRLQNINDNHVEVSQDILKKYEGKSREEIILIASEYEKEVRIQKLKMKELEDYLDDLLLRVMETQPKLLQNPYRFQNSTKG